MARYRDFRVVEWSIRQHPWPGDPAHGIPAGDGYILNLELSPIGEPEACSTILGGTATATLDNEPSGTAVTAATVTDSVTIAPDGDGPFVIFGAAGAIGAGPPRPNNVVAGSGYTTLHSDRVTSDEPAGGTIYTTGASAGSQAVNFVYDTGYEGVSRIGIVAAAFESSATAPVQDAEIVRSSSGPWEITFASPTTSGNLLILGAIVRELEDVFTAGSINPPGWTLLASATVTDSWSIGGTGPEWPVALYARCSDGTETTIELPFLGREAFLSLSEWEL